ncbi:MAG TPA: S9 family peptidase [Candidatus Limnocylindria bacterium]|nr:S9 family peptidase [Candidatus Limnocylindria bacterium]
MATTAPRTKGSIDVHELWSLPSLYHPVLSHKRDRIAFYWDKSGRIELYILDLATRQVRQLSHGEPPRALRSFYVWTPDDTALVFARDEKGNENHDLYRIDATSGAVTRLTDDPKSEKHAIELSPDGAWLTVNSNGRHPSEPDKPGQMNVWRVRADGSELAPLTRYSSPANGGRWSPDGAWLIFNTDEEAPGTRNRDGYRMRPDGSDVRRIFRVKAGAMDTVLRWLPDGARLVVQSDASGTQRAGILTLASGEVRWLGRGERDEVAQELSPSGTQLLVSRHRDAAHQLVAYDIATGAERTVNVAPGVVGNADWVDEDRVVFSHNTSATRTGLFLHDLRNGRTETLVAPEYGAIDARRFVEAEHIWYPSTDGTTIPALLYRPRNVAPGDKRPAMVQAHGGPTGQWTRAFDQFAQVLVDRGFVVIQPNVRGSTGYGVPHRDAALKDWGGIDLEDIEGAVRHLRSLADVDPERIGIMGGSYGGFMSFIAATKRPHLWKAAVPSYGVTDLHAMWAESKQHFRHFLRTQMGDPEADRARWRDRSAVEFADQVTAKLLILHGTNDPRCPVSQSRLFVDKLRSLGRREGQDFTYVEWDDEGHGSVDIAAKDRRFTLVLDWLSETLAA